MRAAISLSSCDHQINSHKNTIFTNASMRREIENWDRTFKLLAIMHSKSYHCEYSAHSISFLFDFSSFHFTKIHKFSNNNLRVVATAPIALKETDQLHTLLRADFYTVRRFNEAHFHFKKNAFHSIEIKKVVTVKIACCSRVYVSCISVVAHIW